MSRYLNHKAHAPLPLKDYFTTVLKCTGSKNVTVAAATELFPASATVTVRGTNPNDVYGAGEQPYGWDTMQTLYDEYRVLGYRTEWRIQNTASGDASRGGGQSPFYAVVSAATTQTGTGIDAGTMTVSKAIDNPNIRVGLLPAPEHGGNTGKIKGLTEFAMNYWIPSWFKKIGANETIGDFSEYWTDVTLGPANFNVDHAIRFCFEDTTEPTSSDTTLRIMMTTYLKIQFRNPLRSLNSTDNPP